MYKIFYSIIAIFYILDILDMPFMNIFDTTYPINGWAWLLIILFLPSTSTIIKHKNSGDEEWGDM